MPGRVPRRTRSARGVAVVVVVIAAVLLALLWAAWQPWTANHLGYALPGGPDGLPARLHYGGRGYDRGETPRCWSRTALTGTYGMAITQVGFVFTLFGLPQPIVRARLPGGPADATDTVIFVAARDRCYVAYALSGGP